MLTAKVETLEFHYESSYVHSLSRLSTGPLISLATEGAAGLCWSHHHVAQREFVR